ncbi:MAG: hypothetical protein MUF25_20335 [Pirellulaceae bacterium]|nr:hypothetical protein [Pirellulaceae bacterium]
MTKKTLVLLWMLFPVGVAAYHFNEGPRQMARERGHARLLEIRQLAREPEPDWEGIIRRYNELTAELPPDEDPQVVYQIRLAICEARLEMLDLATAIEDLTGLLQETAARYGENAPLTRGVREQLGKAHYQATWVLKTSGASEDEWRPFAERSRQLFRYLAELENPREFEQYEQRVRRQFERAMESTNERGAVEHQLR